MGVELSKAPQANVRNREASQGRSTVGSDATEREKGARSVLRLSEEELEASIEAWIPDDFDLRVATKRENGEWFALAVDFDVTGKGSTRQAAVRQMGDLIGLYLAAYFVDHEAFASAIRPVPLQMRFRIQAEDFVSRLVRRIDAGVRLSREDNYILPVSDVAAHARC